MTFLDFLFPRYCLSCRSQGKYICDFCLQKVKSPPPVCPVCQNYSYSGTTHPLCKSEFSLDGLTSLYKYQGVIRKAILGLKYRFATDIADELSQISIYRIKNLKFQIKNYIFVPVPLAPNRLRTRGFNQSHLIGEKLARHFHCQYLPDLLIRSGSHPPQTKLKRAARLQNIANAFQINAIHQPLITDHQSLVVFDDVYTTGATLSEAAKVLKQNGVKQIWGLTLAR